MFGFRAEGPRERTYKVEPSLVHEGTWVASYSTPKGGRMLGHQLADHDEAKRTCVQHAGHHLEWVRVVYR